MEERGRGEALGLAALREAAAKAFLERTLQKFRSEDRGRSMEADLLSRSSESWLRDKKRWLKSLNV